MIGLMVSTAEERDNVIQESSAREILLRQECRDLSRALWGGNPSEYIIGYYIRGHATIPYLQSDTLSGIDRELLAAVTRGGWRIRAADAYARIFHPRAAIRQKLILLLAIVEHAPGDHRHFDTALVASVPVTVMRVCLALLRFGGFLLLGVARFGVYHAVRDADSMPRKRVLR